MESIRQDNIKFMNQLKGISKIIREEQEKISVENIKKHKDTTTYVSSSKIDLLDTW